MINMYKKWLLNALTGAITAFLGGIISELITFSNRNSFTYGYSPRMFLLALAILFVFGFLTGTLLGYFIEKRTFKAWLKGGLLGIGFAILLAFTVAWVSASLLGAGSSFFFITFLQFAGIWILPSYGIAIGVRLLLEKIKKL